MLRNLFKKGKISDAYRLPESLELVESDLNEIHRLENQLRRRYDRLQSEARGGEGLFLEGNSPWLQAGVDPVDIPGMITDEERRYFRWLTEKFGGNGGEIVELGPWLGLSTNCLCQGLKAGGYQGKLWVYDDFIWRASWMDGHVVEGDRLKNHSSFVDLFWRFNRHLDDLIEVNETRFVTYDGNDKVKEFCWNGGKIGLLIVDCGRTLDANNAWYRSLREHFIPGKTIIVMQDYGVCEEIPRKWFNQTWNFVGNRGQAFQKIHEVSSGCAATFLFHGGDEATV